MGERTLRGARLGGQSFEDERGIEFAARQQVGYKCPQGHEFEITMSVEADIPAHWECPRCGAVSLSVDGIQPEENITLSLMAKVPGLEQEGMVLRPVPLWTGKQLFSMLLPRETSSATNPHENAPATAEESPTRHATFENGKSHVKIQV